VFEAMIGSGALDELGGHRQQYLAVLDTALQEGSLMQQERVMGQGSLFGGDEELAEGTDTKRSRVLPNLAAQSESERLAKEKEILGFYISGHPLEPFRVECELFATRTVAELGTWSTDQIAIGCVVTAIRKQLSKKTGAEFARLTVEDFSGSSEVLVFPEAWGLLGDRMRTDIPILMKGGYSRRDETTENPTFIVESVTPFAELTLSGQVAVAIELATGEPMSEDVLRDVRAVVDAHSTSHSGTPPLEFRWNDAGGTTSRLRSRTLRLAATQAALTDLRRVLGTEHVRLVRGS
jgi:DNA polymerase-3 subunit alpha